MNFFLVGMMGAGKSTVGKEVSEHPNLSPALNFVDLDKSIEHLEGRKISEIFSKDGQLGFREMEANYLRTFGLVEDCLISVGGGCPCFEENMQWMKSNGKVFYLQCPETVLFGRLENDLADRPLLAHSDDPKADFSQLLKERRKVYEKADHIIDAGKSLDSVVPKIVYIINLYMDPDA